MWAFEFLLKKILLCYHFCLKKCGQITIFRYAYDSVCVCMCVCVCVYVLRFVADKECKWSILDCVCVRVFVFVCVLNGPFDFYPLRPLKNLRPDLGARHVLIYSNIRLPTFGTLVIFDWLSVQTFKPIILIYRRGNFV